MTQTPAHGLEPVRSDHGMTSGKRETREGKLPGGHVRFPPGRDAGRRRPANRRCGFTMIELVVVMAVVAILALMAVPDFQGRLIREQILDALPLADIAKAPIAASWAALQTFPADNTAAGLPSAEKIVNYYVSALTVQDGAIHITFGNRANPAIKGRILTLRPAVVEDAPIVPVTWVCGYAAPPGKMTVKGENKTNVPAVDLPFDCRS